MEQKLRDLTYGKALIIGLVVSGIYWLTFYDDGSGVQTKIQAAEAQVNTKEAELKATQKAIDDAARFKIIAQQLGEQMVKVTQAIPAELSMIDLMKLLSTEAKVIGANIISVSEGSSGNSKRAKKPRKRGEKASADDEFFEEITVNISLECTFAQMMMYLSNLTKVDKIITLKSLSLATGASKEKNGEGGTPMLNLTATISAYRYLGNQEG